MFLMYVSITGCLFVFFQAESLDVLYDSLGVLIKSVPATKLQEFFEGHVLPLFGENQNEAKCNNALSGLQRALHVQDPPQAVTLLLYQTLEKVYAAVPESSSVSQELVKGFLET